LTQDLKRVVIVAGAGVPVHMVELLRGAGATVVPQGAHREIGEDEVKLVLDGISERMAGFVRETPPSMLTGPWIDEAASITPEMMDAILDADIARGGGTLRATLDAIEGPFIADMEAKPHPWIDLKPELVSKRKRRRLRGTR